MSWPWRIALALFVWSGIVWFLFAINWPGATTSGP